MNTQDYIKELRKQLSGLDNDKTKNIIKEIESYIEESNATYEIIVERFGTPALLAEGYLEDMPTTNKRDKNRSIIKRTLLIMLGFFLLAIAIILFVFYKMTQDPFDYSKYTATTVEQKLKSPWVTIDNNINKININQSQSVIYWSNDNKLQISCKRDKYKQEENTLFIKQSRCIIKVPKQNLDLKILQAKVVLVTPTKELNINAEQSHISIVEKNNQYNYSIIKKQSDINNLKSKENGILIKGTLSQSDFDLYKY
ncbi:hypothetical protein Arnit_2101 [Arcobacter nitrofigilis DSM 7299]|uniref:Uncharacterized protein n=1 Tax=Arcobacter nitrofigilis (strain ATCC 33309 / DSM 7299 / CCUG 15893 / LMG 7604 / NCTC 12251 / CI) TaxID=572480 RepID=D5V0E3_ARCNC|nr:DUF1700 domain-containing protein [Arcobacter nitrofigilis]ADG93755.1 hypothetical protein Arnit_2101 [Arcobacter nitrofigilis DSM 7299]